VLAGCSAPAGKFCHISGLVYGVIECSGRAPAALPGDPGRRVNQGDWRRGRGHHGRVDLDAFMRDGYVAIHGAVDAGKVAACRELIWDAMERRGVRRDDPGSWPPLVDGFDDLPGGQFMTAYLALRG
jgi:hypothetical protein